MRKPRVLFNDRETIEITNGTAKRSGRFLFQGGKQMRETKTHRLSHRLTAALLCLCMIASMLSGFQVRQAYAAAAGGPTENIVKDSRVADPDTMDDYQDRLLTDDTGSRYAGRVWTDKSVFAYGEGSNTITLDMDTDGYKGNVEFNADFAHVFSALASSQVVNEYPPAPIDMVLVLDISSSMGDETEPAEGSVWADIYTALEEYFRTTGAADIAAFRTTYDTEHYLQYDLITEMADGSIERKHFISSEFTGETRFTTDSHLDSDGKMTDQETVQWFLDNYKAGGYIKRRADRNWEYTTEEPPDGVLTRD